MAQVAQVPAVTEPELRPTPPVVEGRWPWLGLLSGVCMVLVSAIGMVESFQPRMIVSPFLPLGLLTLYMVTFIFGWAAGRPPPTVEGFTPPHPGTRNIAVAALTGLTAGVVLMLFVLLATNVDLRGVLIAVSPGLLDILTFGRGMPAAIPLILAVSTVAGALGGLVHLLPTRLRRSVLPALAWVVAIALFEDVIAQMFRGLGLEAVSGFLYASGGGLSPAGAAIVFAGFFALYWWMGGRTSTLRTRFQTMPRSQRQRWTTVGLLVAAGILIFLPRVMGPFISQILDLAGLYLLMALGLNIVLGYAGMLDLGYVAFFAVGAYTAAILTSPQSPGFAPQIATLAAFPFVMLAAALAGVMVGTPVIRMRGDYLAIVTLGFGEIARILLNSEWLAPIFGGAQGITNIPDLQIGPLVFSTPQDYFYPIFLVAVLAAYVTYSLQNSRWGRAWMAIREDELVAEAMGVNIVTAKLSAFVVGAVLASLGGALFGMQIGSVFPHTFDIVVSITVLVIIIVGGMGSVPGVTVGALVLIVAPNLLREFSEYQFLFYGLLLIFMMLTRPEGLIPSKQRAQELHQDEVLQDAWMKIYGDKEKPPATTAEAT